MDFQIFSSDQSYINYYNNNGCLKTIYITNGKIKFKYYETNKRINRTNKDFQTLDTGLPAFTRGVGGCSPEKDLKI
jgi:hypothetical protein